MHLSRAQALAADPLEAIDARLEIARIRADPKAILELATLRLELSDRARIRASLRVEIARAHSDLGAMADAADAWSRAVEERRGDERAQRDITQAWLDWATSLESADSPEGLARELEATICVGCCCGTPSTLAWGLLVELLKVLLLVAAPGLPVPGCRCHKRPGSVRAVLVPRLQFHSFSAFPRRR